MKVRENKLRRMAGRQGLALARSRRRDTLAIDYGTYRIKDANGDSKTADLTLDEAEHWLTHPDQRS